MNEDRGDVNSSSKEKVWERSWTTDEMRQNAHSWNLAGDSGLLKHLQEFSQSVLSHTHATEKALDSLVEEINTAASEISTTNNKFLCLANTQFVENRVYDDDDKETPQDVLFAEKKSKEETEASMLKKVREALSMSVAVLDTMFEPVEIQASDSEIESEDDKQCTKTLLLEPHNPYMHRPLPHLIGSEAFMSDDHIGLGDSPSDSEDHPFKTNGDDNIEVSSESDEEFTAVGASKRSRDMYSSPSSISDNLTFPEETGKRSKKTKPSNSSQDLGFDNGPAVEPPASSSTQLTQDDSFAAQLAAKLGKIAPPPIGSNSTIEKNRDEQKSDLFGAPISEDEDDALFARGSGFFSSRPKLFDDLEDTNKSLWGSESQETYKNPTSDIGKTGATTRAKDVSQVDGGDLFSQNVSDDEDDLFLIRGSEPTKTGAPIKQSSSETISESSGISNPQLLHVAGFRPGVATSTPERATDEEDQGQMHTNENKSGLFDDTSKNPSKDISTINAAVEGSEKKEQLSTNSTMREDGLSPKDKKPAGGVPMFGQSGVLAGLKAKLPRRHSSSSESDFSAHDPPERGANTLPESQQQPSVGDQPVDESENVGSILSGGVGSFHHSQGTSMRLPSQGAFSSPTFTSTRLSNDDGYQTRNVSQPVSSIPILYSNDGDSDGDDLFSSKLSKFSAQKPQEVLGGLFADINDEEDDLFAVSSGFGGKSTKQVYVPSASHPKVEDPKPEPTIHKNSNEKLVQQILPKPLPATAVSTTNNTSKVSLDKGYSNTDQGKCDIFSTVPPPLKSESKVKKPVSLFDDSDSGEDELLFSSASSAGSRRSQASSDLLAASAASVFEKKPLSKKGLFDDDDALFGSTRNDPVIDIFNENGSSKVAPQPGSGPVPSSNTNSAQVEKRSTMQNISNISSGGIDSSASIRVVTSTSAKGISQDDLFADDDEEDDLFNSRAKSMPLQKDKILAPSEDENDLDDLFSVTSKTVHARNEMKLPEPSSQEDPKPKTDIPQPRTLKQSLVVMNEDSPREELLSKSNEAAQISEQKLECVIGNKTVDVSSPMNPQICAIPKPDILQKSKKPEPPKTLDIRKETDPAVGLLDTSDDDDLFDSSTVKVGKVSALPPKPFTKPIVASKPVSKINFPKSDPFEKVNEKTYAEKEKSEISEVDSASLGVSKLRVSNTVGGAGLPAVKIDPRTLLPGGRPPRRTPPKDGVSALLPSLENQGQSQSLIYDKSVGFDEPALINSTLPSANKARAKLGVKRRPPSSKARREAARASQNYDQPDKESPLSPDLSSPADTVNPVSISVTLSNSVLSPSTDEDDLFGVPQDLPLEYGHPNMPATDIFSAATIISPVASVSFAEQLFPDIKEKDLAQEQKQAKSAPYTNKKEALFLPSEDSGESSSEHLASPLCDSLSSELLSDQNEALQASSPLIQKDKQQNPNSVTQETGGVNYSQMIPSQSINILQPDLLSNLIAPDGSSAVPSSTSEDRKSMKITTETVSDTLKTSMPENDSIFKPSGKNTSLYKSTVDPLNKAEQMSKNDEDQLFDSGVTGDSDDHSSLFPFVKKKPENKQAWANRPLFSQTPTLPSKDDKSASKTNMGALNDVDDNDFDDNDLFPSSTKTVLVKKGEINTNIKSKDAKVWHFSDDEDDDDLFFSGAKTVSSKPLSSKAYSSAPTQSASAETSNQSSAKPTVDQKKPTASLSGTKNGLFSDDNDNDDLFSKPSQFLRNKVKEVPPSKSSLFDDDDDDLFASPNVPKVSEQKRSTDSPRTKTQTAAPSSFKKGDVFDDPLMACQDDF